MILYYQVWVGLLISIIACIGCTQFLNYLARKYLVIQSQLYSTITLSNTWMYIIGTLTNHCKDDYICNNSISIDLLYTNNYTLWPCFVLAVNDPRNRPRSVGIVAFIWLLATFVRQYLFLVHGFVHVTKIPTTRRFHISRFGQQSTLPANDY